MILTLFDDNAIVVGQTGLNDTKWSREDDEWVRNETEVRVIVGRTGIPTKARISDPRFQFDRPFDGQAIVVGDEIVFPPGELRMKFPPHSAHLAPKAVVTPAPHPSLNLKELWEVVSRLVPPENREAAKRFFVSGVSAALYVGSICADADGRTDLTPLVDECEKMVDAMDQSHEQTPE